MNSQKSLLMILAMVLVITLGFGLAGRVKAVEFDDDGLIEEGEVIDDDLFIASDVVRINGTINGDLFAAGGRVEINGTVNGSVFAGAQTILVNGAIDGSLYAGSSTMSVSPNAKVSRNLFYGGFNLNTEPDSVVGRDLLVGAYQALLAGQVERDVQAGVAALEIRGVIGGDVIAEVESADEDQMPVSFWGVPGVETIIPTGIRVSEDAQIDGTLRYKSSQNMNDQIAISPGGGLEYTHQPQPAQEKDAYDEVGWISVGSVIGKWILNRVQTFVTLLLLGLLVLWQGPELLRKSRQQLQSKPLESAGWGLASLVIVYGGAVIVSGLILMAALFFGVITLGELAKSILAVGFSSVGLILASFSVLVSYASKLVMAFLAGKFVFNLLFPDRDEQIAWPLIIGIFIYVLFRSIPIVGLGIGILVTIFGLGALGLMVWESRRTRAAQPAGE
jgi:cytoskeletal protein CcmA (bactofilin family)